MLRRVHRALLREAGLRAPDWVVQARCEARALALGVQVGEYVALLDRDGAELRRLVELVRVGETRFFRHRQQMAVLGEVVLPERWQAAAQEGRPLRLWSAGCASGEEAWTLAMLAAAAGARWEVLGTDLSSTALAAAAAGRYPAAALAGVPREMQGYFREGTDGTVVAADELREGVRFRQRNLLEAAPGRRYDVVLCRNVLIYFDEGHRRLVLERLVASLAPGGYLVLGAAEVLREAAPPLQTQGGGMYWLGVEATGHRSSPLPAAPQGPQGGGEGPDPRRTLLLCGTYGDGTRLQQELRPFLHDRAAAQAALSIDLDHADYLGDGDARVLRRAAEVLDLRLCASRPAVQRWLRRHHLPHEQERP